MNLATYLLLLITFITTYNGFINTIFLKKYSFEVDKILVYKDYKRLITNGFLHLNWMHLAFNMFTLYIFGKVLETQIGELQFLLLYFLSLLGGNLFSLFIHKEHGDYSSVGASGAICGVMFACIALFPEIRISILFLPIGIPSWLFVLLYICYTIFGIKANHDNIAHEAHLGGGLTGMLIAILFYPSIVLLNPLPIIIITVPTFILLYLLIKKPHLFLTNKIAIPIVKEKKKYYTIEDKYNTEKINKQKELDKLLEKISKKGIDSLSKNERKRLEELSK